MANSYLYTYIYLAFIFRKDLYSVIFHTLVIKDSYIREVVCSIWIIEIYRKILAE